MKTFLTAVILTILINPVFAQVSVSQIVAQGVPADMATATQAGRLNSCSVVFSSDVNNNPALVAAAYVNSVTGHLRMLSAGANGTTSSVVADITEPTYLLEAGDCKLELVNLNSDTGNNPMNPKVLMLNLPNFSSTDGDMTWFFAWSGNNFVNLGPTSVQNGLPPVTVFHNAGPVDLDHASAQQIESIGYDGDLHTQPDGITADPTINVYSFNGTSFQPEKSLVLAAQFQRNQGKPVQVQTDITPDNCNQPGCYEFEVRNPGTLYKLTAINGTAAGNNRVSSAHVLLNNVEVISPGDLNQQVGTISKTVQITQRNTVYASLDGAPGGTLSITIEPIQ